MKDLDGLKPQNIIIMEEQKSVKETSSMTEGYMGKLLNVSYFKPSVFLFDRLKFLIFRL